MGDQVRKLIQEIARQQVAVVTIAAKVTAVNTDDLTCDVAPVDGGAEFFTVRLRSVIDTSKGGFVVIPKVGSTVLVSLIGNNDQSAYISAVSEADEIWMKGTDYEGIVKAVELKTQLDKTNAVVNAIVDALMNWTVVPSDGGAALKAYFAAVIAGKATGDFSNIQNTKVKHGSV